MAEKISSFNAEGNCVASAYNRTMMLVMELNGTGWLEARCRINLRTRGAKAFN